tara:strand:+ start:43 stop:882 length:840 start_codon:yes stop_codon:yes gene_type:complete
MDDCNFTYISSQIEIKLDMGLSDRYDFYGDLMEKEYPHIWYPDFQILGRGHQFYLSDYLIYWHENFFIFHNLYASLLEVEKKETDYLKMLRDHLDSFNSKKSLFSKNNPITQPHRKTDLEYALHNHEHYHENMDIPKFRDQAFYSLLFPFLLDILKTYAWVLTDTKSMQNGKNTEFEDFKAQFKKDKTSLADYIIYGKYIDDKCGITDLNQLFYEDQYKYFNAARNTSMHEQSSQIYNKVTICECFKMIKKLIVVLVNNKKIEQKMCKRDDYISSTEFI